MIIVYIIKYLFFIYGVTDKSLFLYIRGLEQSLYRYLFYIDLIKFNKVASY
jgi:hypothetical protein